MVLKNGVVLLGTLRAGSQGYEMSKAAAELVFNGEAKEVLTDCFRTSCAMHPHECKWDVGRSGRSISIGCVRFSPDDVDAVRNWIGTKKSAVA